MTNVDAVRILQGIRSGTGSGCNLTDEALGLAIEALRMTDNAVDEGYLADWYINSVPPDDEPVWTEEHVAELAADFIVIPRPDNGHIPVTEPIPAVPDRGWIPCSERMPEESGCYLVCTEKSGAFTLHYYMSKGEFSRCNGLITHWMELPETPDVESGKEQDL